MSGQLIALVGMPGCGKSTVGKHLARLLGWVFVDSDTEIERALGHSIREHFERFGESSFRDAEAAQIALLSALPHTVVATGGGGGSSRGESPRTALCRQPSDIPQSAGRRLGAPLAA